MSPEEMSAMTLADLEAMADRFGKAVQTIKEAQRLLGPTSITAKDSLNVHGIDPGQVMRGPPPPQLLPHEVAERERLMRQFKTDGLPDNIKALEAEQ